MAAAPQVDLRDRLGEEGRHKLPELMSKRSGSFGQMNYGLETPRRASYSSHVIQRDKKKKVKHNILIGCKHMNADNVLPLLHKGRKHINGLISSYAEFN